MASKSTSGPSLSNTDDCGSSSRAFQKKGPAEGSSGKAEAVPKVDHDFEDSAKVTPSSNACTCLRGTSYALCVCLVIIGASLSEPHTYVKYATAVCMCIYIYVPYVVLGHGANLCRVQNRQNGRPLRSHCVRLKYSLRTALNEK